ncbi:MAG: hypothetical protein KZQ83_13880 [gamma proteobacterium symbiont of Taylorina sp.]|nr:hypothetical protein [gamma proteobacterium symbiont of Taylorina sp.]
MGLHLNLSLHKLPFMLVGVAFIATSSIVNAGQSELGPRVTIPESSGDKCILPASEMRRRHPDLLKHDRIQTLREGLRANADGSMLDGSLKQCVNCHAIKSDDKYVRIDNNEHFCVSCHKYAAVSIDCFQCHRDIPEGSSNFHALSGTKKHYGNVLPGVYTLTNKDVANIAPEVRSDDN